MPFHSINISEGHFTGLMFSPDGLRIFYLQKHRCWVWAPGVLTETQSRARTRTEEEELTAMYKPTTSRLRSQAIRTPIIASPDGRWIVARRSDGDVVLFSASDGREVGILYKHGRLRHSLLH